MDVQRYEKKLYSQYPDAVFPPEDNGTITRFRASQRKGMVAIDVYARTFDLNNGTTANIEYQQTFYVPAATLLKRICKAAYFNINSEYEDKKYCFTVETYDSVITVTLLHFTLGPCTLRIATYGKFFDGTHCNEHKLTQQFANLNKHIVSLQKTG